MSELTDVAKEQRQFVSRPPALYCPHCGRIAKHDEKGDNYPCERCGAVWRWRCSSGRHEDIVITGNV